MKKVLFLALISGVLCANSTLYEVRYDNQMCALTGGGDRRIVRKAPTNGSCLFPIPAQKNCLISGFSNAKTFRYDGNKFVLTPQNDKEPALGDIVCESVR